MILSTEMAGAARSALVAGWDAGLHVQVALTDTIDVYVEDHTGYVVVRDTEANAREEYSDIGNFQAAYSLPMPQRDLLTVVREMESLCETLMKDALLQENSRDATFWNAQRERCRSAIQLSGAGAGYTNPAL